MEHQNSHVEQRLESLRGYRVRRPESPLSDSLARLVPDLRRKSREHERIAGLLELWDAAAPDNLRPLASPTGYARGRLELRCADAGARHMIDRWLRGGGLGLLRSLSPMTLRDVRIGIAPIVNNEE